MKHFLNKNNLGLVIGRQGQVVGSMQWNLVYLTKNINDFNLFYRGGGMSFPLYLYEDQNDQQTLDQSGISNKKPNLNLEIIKQIEEKIGLSFEQDFSPEDLFDYIYAVLHSPSYREKYKEFLKIDFPRIPFDVDKDTFWKMVEKGNQLRKWHLMEHEKIGNLITKYPITGSNEVEKPKYEKQQASYKEQQPASAGCNSAGDTENTKLKHCVVGKVWINKEQYFEDVPEVAWNFYIGGYQPAQKWLKDRKGRVLSFDDILHYQKVIVALVETDRVMREIEGVFEV
jgi:predicted helicase